MATHTVNQTAVHWHTPLSVINGLSTSKRTFKTIPRDAQPMTLQDYARTLKADKSGVLSISPKTIEYLDDIVG
jgi:hypothetical protein